MAGVFDEPYESLSDRYLDSLLARPEFWAFVALRSRAVVGGLTAHALQMTTREAAEVFLYDIAVDRNHQRQGIGRRLVEALRFQARAAGIQVVFVPAENEDIHAIEFYKALGGSPTDVTFFEFGPA